jgi:hypothetical protein
MSEELKAIEARLKTATPGPWHYNRDFEEIKDVEGEGNHWILETLDMTHIGYIAFQEGPYPLDEANIDLIANAPSDIAFLLARIVDLEKELETKDILSK